MEERAANPLETGGHQPSPWERRLGLEWTRPGQGTRRGKKRERKAELVGIPGVSFAQFSKRGPWLRPPSPRTTAHSPGSPRQQSRVGRLNGSLLTSHPGGIRVCGCHSIYPLAHSLPPGSVALGSRGHTGLSQGQAKDKPA